MDSEDFRNWSHQAADWGADYRETPARPAGARQHRSPATSRR